MSAYFGRNAMIRAILDQGVRPNVLKRALPDLQVMWHVC